MASIIEQFQSYSPVYEVGDYPSYTHMDWDTEHEVGIGLDAWCGWDQLSDALTFAGVTGVVSPLRYTGETHLLGKEVIFTQEFAFGGVYYDYSSHIDYIIPIVTEVVIDDDESEWDVITFTGTAIAFPETQVSTGILTEPVNGFLFLTVPNWPPFFHYSKQLLTGVDLETPVITLDCPCPAWNNYNGTEEICIAP